MRKILIAICLLTLVFASCEKLLMPKSAPQTATSVFEELWKTMDRGYVFFDNKGIKWDSIYQVYKPIISDTMTDHQLYDTCVQMLNILKDGSISLNAGFATSYYARPEVYAANFRKELLEHYYWKGYEKTGPFLYKVKDSVGYIYYNFTDDISEAQIEAMIDRLKELGGKKGTILDIRNSKGGNPANMYKLYSHMGLDSNFEYSIYLFQSSYKNGPGHDQFTDYAGSYVDKNSNKKIGRKVVLLTNRGIYGVSSIFVSGSKGFHNVKVMGDTTGGGGSLTSSYELPNGWVITYPSSKVKASDGSEIEDGVAPDTLVQMKAADEALGKDTILDAAMAEILK